MNDASHESRFDLRRGNGLLNVAGVFEGGVALLALFLGWLTGVDPLSNFGLHWRDLAWGVCAAGGLLLLLLAGERLPIAELRRIKELVLEFFGRPMSECRWYELLLLAGLVGYCEELLFRGFLQPWLERSMSNAAALLLSNLLFGLLHAVTAVYWLLAFLIGLYLGWLLDATGERRLMIPVLTHALYDFVGFILVAREYRRRGKPAEAADSI